MLFQRAPVGANNTPTTKLKLDNLLVILHPLILLDIRLCQGVNNAEIFRLIIHISSSMKQHAT